MGDHTLPTEPTFTASEPVAIAEMIRVLITALVAAGWIALDTPVVNLIATVVAVLLSVVLTWLARRKVTSLGDPRDDQGQRLVPLQDPPQMT